MHRFELDGSPNCPTCSDIPEDLEHVMVCCARFEMERQNLNQAVDRGVSPVKFVAGVLKSNDLFTVSSGIIKMQELLKKESRKEQNET